MANSEDGVEEVSCFTTASEVLDDPYLELFDRINQQDLEIAELKEMVLTLHKLYDAATMPSKPMYKLNLNVPNNNQHTFKFFE